MLLNNTQAIYLFSIFIVFFLVNMIFISINNKGEYNPIMVLFIGCLVSVIVLTFIYKCCNKNVDSFTFEVSPPKLCQGWPYMQSSAPQEIKDYCQKLFSTEKGRDAYNSMNCPGGFPGRPVHWERTSMSNDKWENEMCR